MIQPKKSLRDIIAYEVPLYEKEWSLKIDSNENLYGPSPKVLEAINNISEGDIKFYPVYGELSQKIADFIGFNIDNIKVTNGADEAIYSIFQAYIDAGDKVLTVKPTFSMPLIYAKVLGADVIEVPYEEKWKFPIDTFLSKIKDKDVKIVHLTTPNNPTGDAICKEDMSRIISAAEGKAVLIDETYGNYCDISYKDLVKENDNVFLVKSFSKDFALAGLRLGYIISSSENIKTLKAVVSPYSVNIAAVKAGIAALDDVQYFKKIKLNIENSKQILKDLFENSGAKVYPSSANFLCLDFGKKAGFVEKKLLESNIKVKKFKHSDTFDGTLRVTAPKPEDAKMLKEVLALKPTLIFDMDGVLLDAGSSYRTAIKQTFEHFSGKKISLEEIQSIKNSGGLNNDWDLTDFLLKKEGLKIDKSEIINIFQEIYWNDGNGLINNEELLIDKNFFENNKNKFNFAIFTGRPREEAVFALKKNNMYDYFFPIITMDDIPFDKQKPDNCGLEKIKEMILSDKIYYFGDTIDDMICASSAGITAIGILPPQDKSDELACNLKQKGAKIILNNINELINKISECDYEMQCKNQKNP